MFEDLHRGDKVVCIDATIKPEMLLAVVNMYPNWLKQDEVYTVRGFYYNDGIVTGVLLDEIRNPPVYIKLIGRTQEPAFMLERLKKIEEISSTEEIEEEIENDTLA